MKILLVILGPTACGKTAVAARLAFELGGEVISADSRQVYRGMDLGSGKDLDDYIVEGKPIPYHLINIAEPGYEYNIFEYQKDFAKVFDDIVSRGKVPVLCGGSGMYLEAVLKGYSLPEAPPDPGFASRMNSMDNAALQLELSRLKKLHSTTDTSDRSRMLRALEIEMKRFETDGASISHKPRIESEQFTQAASGGVQRHRSSGVKLLATGEIYPLLFGINPGRDIVRRRITERLQARLEHGMIDEVRKLMGAGVPAARLKAYGLEYKFLTQYLEGALSYEEMFRLLNTAIHQFAKRQMTWFRRMEKQGMKIHWIEGDLPSAEKVKQVRELLQ